MSDRSFFPIIEHLKSGLSISSHSGCSLSCAYCLLHTGKNDDNYVQFVEGADAIINRLKEPQTLFLNGMTPLFINNRTDPFLPEVEKYTFQILDMLIENGIRSPIVLVSKLIPSRSLKEYCKRVPLLLFYSYSALPEDVNFNDIRNVSHLTELIYPENLYHYMRPIIPGKNDDITLLQHTILKFAQTGFSGSIVSGIRITKGNYQYLGSKPEEVSNHKYLSYTVYDSLVRDPLLHDMQYSLFRHTSCAIDSFMNRGNRLGYYQRDHHCNIECRNFSRCSIPYPMTNEIHSQIVDRFPEMVFTYDRVRNSMIIKTPVSQEVTAFLKNAYGFRVEAQMVTLSPSEEVLANE